MSRANERGLPLSTGWRVAVGLAALFTVTQPFLYWSVYAGDAVIHLVFAENAANGAFFEFNPGEIASGVTSTGYMLWLALWFHYFPTEVVPVAAKLGGILAYWGAAAMLFGLARDLLRSSGWAAAIALVFGAMPGSAFNSAVGMETSFFLALSVGWLWWAIRSEWFSGGASSAAELGIGMLLGASFWLRPEAALMGICAFGLRAVRALRSDAPARDGAPLLLSAAAALAVAASALAFHQAWTGGWLPTSGRARVFIAQVVSPTFGPLLFDSTFSVRLAAYAPITLLFLLGLPAVWRRNDALDIGDAGRFSSLLFAAGFALYTFVTGAHHLARYIAFLMPGFVLIAGATARDLHANWSERVPEFARPYRSAAFIALASSIAVLYSAELSQRVQQNLLAKQSWIGGEDDLMAVRSAPAMREQASDAWIERLGNPSERPIVIAMQEVQLRYQLDERFVVRSLDGRVDSALFDYVTPTDVDHIGYLRHRDVHFVLDAPHYVADPRQWSMVSLRGLAPGEQISREGLTFTRLQSAPFWRVDTNGGRRTDERPKRRRQRRRLRTFESVR